MRDAARSGAGHSPTERVEAASRHGLPGAIACDPGCCGWVPGGGHRGGGGPSRGEGARHQPHRARRCRTQQQEYGSTNARNMFRVCFRVGKRQPDSAIGVSSELLLREGGRENVSCVFRVGKLQLDSVIQDATTISTPHLLPTTPTTGMDGPAVGCDCASHGDRAQLCRRCFRKAGPWSG